MQNPVPQTPAPQQSPKKGLFRFDVLLIVVVLVVVLTLLFLFLG